MRRSKRGREAPQSADDLLRQALEDVEAGHARDERRRARKKRGTPLLGRLKENARPLAIVVLIVALVLLIDGLRREYKEFSASLTAVRGTVRVVKKNAASPAPADEKTVLQDEDLVMTGPQSTATIVFPDGSAVLLESNTKFEVRLIDFARGGRRDRSVMVHQGSVLVRISEFFGARSEATVCTPTAVAAVRGTSFRVSYDPAKNASGVEVATGLVEFRTPVAKGNVAVGRAASTSGYQPRATEGMKQEQRRRLAVAIGQLQNYEEPPGKLHRFEWSMINLADPVLQLLGIVPGSWGYNSIDAARRTACMEALRRLRLHLEQMNQGPPEVLNPVTFEELGLHEKEVGRFQNAFAGRMIDSYQRVGLAGYEVIARARDKKRTGFRMTNAELVRLDE